MTERTASQADHRTVLLRGGDIHSPADPFATAMVVERGHVAWVGSEGAADAFASGVDETVDLEGALVTPAFTDAHVHTTATGLALTGLDLSGARTAAEALALVRTHAAARPGDKVLLGHGWDAARWTGEQTLSRRSLDEAAGGRPLYLPRIDVHSAVVSTALLDLVPGVTDLAGYHPDAPLTGAAHHAVRAAAHAAVTPCSAPRRSARRAATPPRSVSARSTSAAAPRSPTRTTSRHCSPSRPTRRGPGSSATGPRRLRTPRTRTASVNWARSAPRATSSPTAPSVRTPPASTSRTPTPRTRARPTSTRPPSPLTSSPAPRPGSRPVSTPSATPRSPPSSRAYAPHPRRSAWPASVPPATASSTPRC